MPAEEVVGGRVGADGAAVRPEQVAAAATVALLGRRRRRVEVREDGRGREDLLVGGAAGGGGRVLPAAEGERRPHGHHVHHGDVAEGELDDKGGNLE